jgi:hypothetical protein
VDAWLIALVSGGLTLLASLSTTFLNGRSATRNLRAQLASEERRHDDQRQADERARLFEHQRESAVRFLTAMTTYQISSAKVLGATFARSQADPRVTETLEYEAALESMSGHSAARDSLTDALSAVTVYFPRASASSALRAVHLEHEWFEALQDHYLSGKTDPGPYPREIDQAIEEFRATTRRVLGVDSGS